MSKPISISELRANIYRLIGKVAESGEPLLLERDGVVLRVERAKPPTTSRTKPADLFSRIRRAKLKPILQCKPEELLNLSWDSEWSADDPS